MSSPEFAVDRLGRGPLHLAVLGGDVAEVERLLSLGADPNAADANGFTPLHYAAQQGELDATRLLLHGGASVDARNSHGNTPLFVAVFNSRGRGDIIESLRDGGADPGAVNNYDQSPVGLARLIANYDVRQYFSDLDSTS